MPAVTFSLRSRATGRDRATIVDGPVYFGMHDSSSSRDWAQHGSGVKTFLIRDEGLSRDGGAFDVLRGFSLRDSASGSDRAQVSDLHPARPVEFSLFDSSPGDDRASLNALTGFALHDGSPGRDSSLLAAYVPHVAIPEEGQAWGTVNIVENSNLEYDEVGLLGWEAEDAVLTRTSAAVAASGSYSGEVLIPAASVAPRVRIRSVRGMDETGYGRRWVGSAYLRGDSPSLGLSLLITYRDGTQDQSDPVTVDSIPDPDPDPEVEEVLLTDDWARFAANAMSSDGAKRVERIEVVIDPVSDPLLDTILRIDAVQIEEDRGGGVTTYADGDQGEGHSWLGAAGQSASMRATA